MTAPPSSVLHTLWQSCASRVRTCPASVSVPACLQEEAPGCCSLLGLILQQLTPRHVLTAAEDWVDTVVNESAVEAVVPLLSMPKPAETDTSARCKGLGEGEGVVPFK